MQAGETFIWGIAFGNRPIPLARGRSQIAAWAAAAPIALLCDLLELLVDELNLGSDDDLNRGLARTDNAGSAGGLNLLLVNQQTVLDFQSQTSDAVVDGGNVCLLYTSPSPRDQRGSRMPSSA